MKHITMLTSLFAALAISASAACLPNDDAGNAAGSALVIPSAGYNTTHNLEHRSDVDYFVFTAIPFATYTFTVSEGSAPDLDVCLRGPDGSYILDRENSASGSSVTFSWPPAGSGNIAGGLMYLDVRSLGEAKSGSYTFNMTANYGPDNDNDNLPDQWEASSSWANGPLNTAPGSGASGPNGWQHDFDGDGFTNWQELQMGTDPTAAGSSLIILDIEKDITKAEVQWPAVKNGFYEVSWRTNDATRNWTSDADWNVIDSMFYQGNSANIWTDDFDGIPPEYKIYRVQQFGISSRP